jgi:hypothetical protein
MMFGREDEVEAERFVEIRERKRLPHPLRVAHRIPKILE